MSDIFYYDISLKKGDTYAREIHWEDVNGTPVPMDDCNVFMQVRSTNSKVPVLTLASDQGTLRFETGKIFLEIPKERTQYLRPMQGVYDLQIEYPHGVVVTLMTGSFTVLPDYAIRQ